MADPATARAQYADDERALRARGRRRPISASPTPALPLRVVHLGTVWTVLFTEPGRYNWLLQYYLRAEGVTLSWVGTGRCLSSMDFTDEDYDALGGQARSTPPTRMKADGWWLTATEHPGRTKRMRAGLVREVLGELWSGSRDRCTPSTPEVMRRKKDDHHASHSNVVNQLFHIISSSVFLVLLRAGLLGPHHRDVGRVWPRCSSGRSATPCLEPPCHDKEALLLGYNTRNKTLDPRRVPRRSRSSI